MFRDIKTLRDLNAARIQESSKEGADLMAINNAYNTARQRIMSERKPYTILNPIVVKARECAQHRSIPVVGHCAVTGTIQLTEKGFMV